MKNVLFVFIVVFCLSCGKEEDDLSGFKYLDIEDAYGIVIGKYTSGTDNAYGLFKINKTDKLEKVAFLNNKKEVVKTGLIPVAGYDLDDNYLLITFRKENQTVPESFLIRRFDGYAQRLPKAVIAKLSGNTDFRTKAIRSDGKSGYYFTNATGNWKLNLNDLKKPTIEEIYAQEEFDKYFSVDYMGNLLTCKKIYHFNGSAGDLQWKNSMYTFPLNSYINNMYYIFRNNDSIQCSRIDVSTSTISEEKLYPSFLLSGEEAAFVNSHVFPGFDKIFVTLSSAILQIEGTTIKQADLTLLDLKKIIASQSSQNYCFIFGENIVNEKVFLKIDFKPAKPLYTQIVAPGEISVRNFSVSAGGNLVFSGNKISTGKHLFGYIPSDGSNWIFDDDEDIEEVQVLVR